MHVSDVTPPGKWKQLVIETHKQAASQELWDAASVSIVQF